MALAAVGLAVVFNLFPRSTFSELEKRELKKFPDFSWAKVADGSFTRDVSAWFSDSEPYRDRFMELSMLLKDWMRVATSDENVSFHAPTANPQETIGTDSCQDARGKADALPYDGTAKIANAGIIIMGTGPNVRALMTFSGSASAGGGYAEAANLYYQAFEGRVQVYCMVIPTAIEYYCPEKVRSRTRSARATIDNVHARLLPGVKPVEIRSVLGEHVDEDIYLRTDHHWAPLGAYYAAQTFAQVAGVPFRDLSSYDRHVVHRFVGSMYGYSQDIAVKNAPEDFVYYTPRGIDYSTTYTNYTIDEDYHVTGESEPQKGPFFYKYGDGSGGAYCTFMGADTRITRVTTGTKNGRRVLILKDSFGNAIPGYLFFSFEEVHVVDYRYFTKNMKAYVADNHITDILFANNIFSACSSHICRSYARFLTQKDGIVAPAVAEPADSIAPAAAAAEQPKTTAEVPAEQPSEAADGAE